MTLRKTGGATSVQSSEAVKLFRKPFAPILPSTSFNTSAAASISAGKVIKAAGTGAVSELKIRLKSQKISSTQRSTCSRS